MPYNPDLYPTNYPAAQVGSGASVLELAVQNLQVQAESTAVRQASLRRSQGRGTAAVQNAATSVLNSLMPTNIVSGSPPAVVLGTKGFWIGGCLFNVAPTTTIDRLTYNNESVSSIGSGLTVGKWNMGGAASAANGYVAGGAILNGVVTAAIDRLVLGTEVVSTLGGVLTLARAESTGTASATNAYFAGGLATTVTASIERLAFSNEAVSTLGAALSSARSTATSGATPTNAYFLGGFVQGAGYGSNPLSVIDRLLFASETVSALGAVLTRTKGGGAGVNSSTNTYFAGGYTDAKASVTTIERFNFATETISVLGATLSIARLLATGANSSVNGYLGGGVASPAWTSVFSVLDRLVFSGESVAPIGTTLSSARFSSTALSNYTYAVAGA